VRACQNQGVLLAAMVDGIAEGKVKAAIVIGKVFGLAEDEVQALVDLVQKKKCSVCNTSRYCFWRAIPT